MTRVQQTTYSHGTANTYYTDSSSGVTYGLAYPLNAGTGDSGKTYMSNINLGLVPNITLSGSIWHDKNINGVNDDDENASVTKVEVQMCLIETDSSGGDKIAKDSDGKDMTFKRTYTGTVSSGSWSVSVNIALTNKQYDYTRYVTLSSR